MAKVINWYRPVENGRRKFTPTYIITNRTSSKMLSKDQHSSRPIDQLEITAQGFQFRSVYFIKTLIELFNMTL